MTLCTAMPPTPARRWGVPHALYNCIASFQLPLRLEPQARLHSFAKQLDHEIRESLTPERRLFRMAEQMGWVYQVFRQKAALKIKKRVFQMGEYISGFPADSGSATSAARCCRTARSWKRT